MLTRSLTRLSREAQKFRNIGFARYEARDLSRRMDLAQAALNRDAWEQAKVFKDPAEQLWVPFLILACVPLAVLCASLPGELERVRSFLSSGGLTSAVLVEDMQTERAILEYRDSVHPHDADAFTKPELWGQA